MKTNYHWEESLVLEKNATLSAVTQLREKTVGDRKQWTPSIRQSLDKFKCFLHDKQMSQEEYNEKEKTYTFARI